MSKDVVNLSIESNSQFSQSYASLFDEAYNSVSTAFGHVKETVVENPYTSVTIGLAASAGLLYLTRGKLWGAAAETEGAFLKFSTHGSEARQSFRGLSHSPQDPEALLRIRAAARGDLASKVSLTADHTPPNAFDLTRVHTGRVSISRLEPAADPQLLLRIREAAKGDLNTSKVAGLDSKGKELVHPFPKDKFFGADIKKDTLTGPGANGLRISGLDKDAKLRGASGTAAISESVADALAAWMRK